MPLFVTFKKVVSHSRTHQSNFGRSRVGCEKEATFSFDTVRKRLLHSKSSLWTRGCLVVRTLGLFKFNRQVEPTTTLDPFRQSVKHPHPPRTLSSARYRRGYDLVRRQHRARSGFRQLSLRCKRSEYGFQRRSGARRIGNAGNGASSNSRNSGSKTSHVHDRY